jgi:hypothetical protein
MAASAAPKGEVTKEAALFRAPTRKGCRAQPCATAGATRPGMVAMNVFRLLGDTAHLLSFIVMFWKLFTSKSVAGISLKTQVCTQPMPEDSRNRLLPLVL